MHQNYRSSNPVEQSGERIDVHLRLQNAVFHSLGFGRCILVKGRIAWFALAGPLRMQRRLRPELVAFLRSEFLHDVVEGLPACSAIDLRDEGRSPARNLIYDVNAISQAHEVLRPSWTTVGSREEAGAGLITAVDKNNGKWVLALCRNEVLDVHLSNMVVGGVCFVIGAAHVEISERRERQCRFVPNLSGGGLP